MTTGGAPRSVAVLLKSGGKVFCPIIAHARHKHNARQLQASTARVQTPVLIRKEGRGGALEGGGGGVNETRDQGRSCKSTSNPARLGEKRCPTYRPTPNSMLTAGPAHKHRRISSGSYRRRFIAVIGSAWPPFGGGLPRSSRGHWK